MKAKCGIIAGTGLEQFTGGKIIDRVDLATPFGMPSDLLTLVEVNGITVAFLPRHGNGHRLLPTEVPSHANMWALKSLGVEAIIAVSAVGSLKEEYKPGDLVICDGIIDRTSKRVSSYFGNGLVAHVGFSYPFCLKMRNSIIKVFQNKNYFFHEKGTVMCMEGPLFSTRSESELYRSWDADIIGMTALPEAKLAREAEMCYAGIAMVTDYDCWKEKEESVTIEMVLKVMSENTKKIQSLIPDIVTELNRINDCECRHAVENTIMTEPSLIPYEQKRKLALFYDKYWKKSK